MGRDKALIEVDGVAMVDRTAALLMAAGCAPVVAIGPSHLAGAVPVLADRFPGDGPLGAVITALTHAVSVEATGALVVACDLPDLDVATLSSLLAARTSDSSAASLTIAVTDRLEPLMAVWTSACLAPLARLFEAGERSVQRAIDTIDGLSTVEISVDAARIRNVNTPDQLWTE